MQEICKALPEFHLDYVKSLRVHYDSPTVDAMTRNISSIQAFKGLTTSTVEMERGVIPDTSLLISHMVLQLLNRSLILPKLTIRISMLR